MKGNESGDKLGKLQCMHETISLIVVDIVNNLV